MCPPNFKVLERRLRGRATDTDEVIEMRIRNAVSELESIKTYDYLVLNDQLDLIHCPKHQQTGVQLQQNYYCYVP